MERYNLRSGFHVTPTVQNSGRTERDHLTGLAARHVAVLTAEENAPKLNGIERNFTLLQIPWERETHQTQEACELVKSSGVWGEIEVRDFLVTTSTETLPVLSPGTVSTILDDFGNRKWIWTFDVTPPVEAAYATQDVSALTPEQSQTVSQSAPSFQSSPQSRTPTTNTQTQYLSITLGSRGKSVEPVLGERESKVGEDLWNGKFSSGNETVTLLRVIKMVSQIVTFVGSWRARDNERYREMKLTERSGELVPEIKWNITYRRVAVRWGTSLIRCERTLTQGPVALV